MPTFLSENVAALTDAETVSVPINPLKDPVEMITTDVPPSYVLLSAVADPIVNPFAVMFAVVVEFASE